MATNKRFGKELAHYARKNVRPLKHSFDDVIDTASADAVHDSRKATRNLQTVIDACAARRPSHKTRRLRTQLKECRHALSDWRDSDVLLVELKKSERRAYSPAERRCWSKLTEHTALLEKEGSAQPASGKVN